MSDIIQFQSEGLGIKEADVIKCSPKLRKVTGNATGQQES